jgi:hypothetical protein
MAVAAALPMAVAAALPMAVAAVELRMVVEAAVVAIHIAKP